MRHKNVYVSRGTGISVSFNNKLVTNVKQIFSITGTNDSRPGRLCEKRFIIVI